MKAIFDRGNNIAFLREVFDLIPAYVAYVDADLRYVATNRTYLERFGLTREDLIGSRVEDITGEAASTVVPRLQAALRGEVQRFEPVMTSVDGLRTLSVTHLPYRDANGAIVGVIVYGYDVTETRRAQSALLQSEKLAAVGRMASTIAHELNNPLEALSNLIYLAEHTDSLEESRTFLRLADLELRRAAGITAQTLKFNRQVTQPTRMTAEELFESLLESFAARLRNASIVVKKRYGQDVPVLSFEGEIRQVLVNLIGNAIDAMQLSGTLSLRGRVSHDWRTGRKGITFTVADTGTGIAPEVMPTLFQPFHTTKGIGGTGLGLWICKEILERHQGHIRVKSARRPELHGTVLAVFLPFEAAVR